MNTVKYLKVLTRLGTVCSPQVPQVPQVTLSLIIMSILILTPKKTINFDVSY